jgi:NAD(P)-dependent dehydrogenase (short-subunit alcohol dehydrogenase family)
MTERQTATGVALVTGAASGIGAAVARRLAAAGPRALILIDRDEAALDTLANDLDAPEIMRVARDVRDEEAWERIEEEAYMRFGSIDAAVINAGVAGAGTITETSFETWRSVMSVNLDGAFLGLRAAMRLMPKGGSIVVVASAAGVKAEIGVGAYGASKAGVAHLARIAAKEGARIGVRVNAILPGGVETGIWDETPMFQELLHKVGNDREKAFSAMAEMATPLRRFAKPEEIAEQIAFLLSPAAATITGAWLVSDGGYTL